MVCLVSGCDHDRAKAVVSEKPRTFDERVAAARKAAPSGFSVEGQPPFILIGNHSPAIMRDIAVRVVEPTVRLLKKDFFARDPDVTEVWLMRDDRSYRELVRRKLGRDPSTPYGFYIPSLRRMVLNHATGSGTLVHELVHPLVHANLPSCPAWFNEGLASLYERSVISAGSLTGLLNWRLPPFRERILRGQARPLRWMFHASIDDFGADETGDAYAAARYLLYYLQEHELLIPFYRRFAARTDQDRSGAGALLDTVGMLDIEAFERKWHAWLLEVGQPSMTVIEGSAGALR